MILMVDFFSSLDFSTKLHKTDFMKGASRALSPAHPLSLSPSSNPIGGRMDLPFFLPPDAPALPQSQVSPFEYLHPRVSCGLQ